MGFHNVIGEITPPDVHNEFVLRSASFMGGTEDVVNLHLIHKVLVEVAQTGIII